MESDWLIEQSDFESDSEIKKNESLFSLGNGYLGIRGDLIQPDRSFQKGTYINGFYETGQITYGEKAYGFADDWQTIVPLPESKDIQITIGGIKLFNNRGHFKKNSRILNMKKSNRSWNFIWQDELGKNYEGSVTTIIPFSLNGCAVYIWELILPNNSNSIEICSSISYEKISKTNIDDPRLPAHFTGDSVNTRTEKYNDTSQLIVHASGSGLTLASSIEHSYSGINFENISIETSESRLDYHYLGTCDRKIQIVKVAAYSFTNGDKSIAQDKVFNEQEMFRNLGSDKILKNHKKYLDVFWSRSDVIIKGNTEAQKSIRFNLFQLLQSTGKDGKSSIAAKGLSGPGYEGHYFWDAETYVLPFFIYTNPEIARSMILYRISTIDKARERAKILGHKGILFPWRTINGSEASAYFPAGTAQYHINADIALGLIKYLEVTGDKTILNDGGVELLSGTSIFWCDFGSYVKGKGFCFNTVTGPDEYTALVDNNFFTNLLVKKSLIGSCKWLSGLTNEEEIELWKETANNIYLPNGVEITPQDDSFLKKQVWDFDNTLESDYPLLLNYHPLNIYRKQVLKQADVVMAQALFRDSFPPGLLQRNFDYYEKLTTRDSSLSACAQGICAHWLGYSELSWKYFTETVLSDLSDLHNNVFYGLHTASMGGSYLMIINGFLGLENYKNSIRFRPKLPNQLDMIALNITLHGSTLKVILNRDNIEYCPVDNDVTIFHYSEMINIKKGQSVLCNTKPNIKLTTDDEDISDLYAIEKDLFSLIQKANVLPEEVVIHINNNVNEPRYNELGYATILCK